MHIAMTNYANEFRSNFPYRSPHNGEEASEYLATYGESCQGADAANYERQRIDGSGAPHEYAQGLGLLFQRRHVDSLRVFLCPSNPFFNQAERQIRDGTFEMCHYFYLASDGELGSAGTNSGNARARRHMTDRSGRAVVADQGVGQSAESPPPAYPAGWEARQHRNEGHNVLYIGGTVLWLPIDETYPATEIGKFNTTFERLDQ
jgi:hypothetical protein